MCSVCRWGLSGFLLRDIRPEELKLRASFKGCLQRTDADNLRIGAASAPLAKLVGCQKRRRSTKKCLPETSVGILACVSEVILWEISVSAAFCLFDALIIWMFWG